MWDLLPENPGFGAQFARSIGSGFSKGVSQAQEFKNEMALQKQKHVLGALEEEKIKKTLIKNGIPEDQADLYISLSKGGQTAFAQQILESAKREGKFNLSNKSNNSEYSNEDYKDELDKILSTQDQGLTPSEKVSRGKERFSTGMKSYEESSAKLKGAASNKTRFNILEKLNESEKLPMDLGRLNVDKEGNLRLAFAASPESQRYVKTLNEFSSGAKDTFGSRVTNFDLAQYLKRFPTLLNSTEGRKQLLQQMKLVNEIDAVYYKNLKNVYDEAGGVRSIDSDRAEYLAEKKSSSEIEKLVKKFDEIGQFSSIPSASEFKGKKIKNPKTNEILISDGTNWMPE